MQKDLNSSCDGIEKASPVISLQTDFELKGVSSVNLIFAQVNVS